MDVGVEVLVWGCRCGGGSTCWYVDVGVWIVSVWVQICGCRYLHV